MAAFGAIVHPAKSYFDLAKTPLKKEAAPCHGVPGGMNLELQVANVSFHLADLVQ